MSSLNQLMSILLSFVNMEGREYLMLVKMNGTATLKCLCQGKALILK